MSACMIITTCPNQDEAERLAGQLVSEKLAACVQISPIQSIYAWDGAIQNDPEYKLTAKTRLDLFKQVEAYILAHHSYDVPQVIGINIDHGSDDYLNWIMSETISE
ncbi:MAG: divalent-cation tolerance protein CutA [Desulfobacteraceae bacterium]|nr:MAG: divalent-cation tolerance protein CutA [Desulfobacteraceae bacterium]